MAEITITSNECTGVEPYQDGVSVEVLNNEVQIEILVTATGPQGPQGPPGPGTMIDSITNEELEEMLK